MPLNAPAARTAEPLPIELKLLQSSSVVGCFVLGRDGVLRWANALFRYWLTGDEAGALEGRKLAEWLPRIEDRERLARGSVAGELSGVCLALARPGGTCSTIVGDLLRPCTTSAAPHFVGVFRDGGDAKAELDAGMERSARLEALGSLASGVAHDFNNLLTILVGNLALVAEELRDDPKKFAKLKAARDAAKRGGDLIRQLLSFARQEPVESALINPAKVIGKVAPLIERALGSRVRLELELDERAASIDGNSAQLESVIVNLAANARDAIESTGTVRIGVRTVEVDGSMAEARGLEPGKHLCIEVADDGSGIPAGVADRVFEPFFTTKRERGGTGLGLSMVRSYANQFGGRAELSSAPGEGTTIRLWFPCSSGTIEDSVAMTMPVAKLPGGDESVLVLAADRSLRATLEQLLSVLGYRVRVVADLGAANRMLGCPDRPDLLISDGFEAGPLEGGGKRAGSGAMRRLTLRAAGSARVPERNVLLKPFTLPDLATAVRKALDAG